MSLRIYNDLVQGTQEWHDARRGIVTASTVGKLITPAQIKVAANPDSRALTAHLVAERITGITEDTFRNDDMWRGVIEEPRARDHYSKHHAETVECGFMVRTEKDWTLGYSPDGLVGDNGLIEVKAPRAKGHIATFLADDVPLYYMAQCQAALLVSGREWLDFISWHGGLPMFVKRVTPDERWFKAIVAAVSAFEKAAAEMTAAYDKATEGLAETERLEEMELVL